MKFPQGLHSQVADKSITPGSTLSKHQMIAEREVLILSGIRLKES